MKNLPFTYLFTAIIIYLLGCKGNDVKTPPVETTASTRAISFSGADTLQTLQQDSTIKLKHSAKKFSVTRKP